MPTILLVNSDERLHFSLQEKCRNVEGLNIISAFSGMQAVTAFETHKDELSVIFVDTNLTWWYDQRPERVFGSIEFLKHINRPVNNCPKNILCVATSKDGLFLFDFKDKMGCQEGIAQKDIFNFVKKINEKSLA